MTPQWIRDPDAIPSPRDIETVAVTLEGQHGQWAAQIADFFAACHDQRGDQSRSWAWLNVAEQVREREYRRLEASADA